MQSETMVEPFGAWLLKQAKRTDPVGLLAASAKSDPHFPTKGDAEAVRARLRALQADGDVFAVVDDAEAEWLPG